MVSWLSRLLPGRDLDDGVLPGASSDQALAQAPLSPPRGTPAFRATPATRMARIPGTRSTVLAMAGVLPWIVWVVLAALLLACLGAIRLAYPPDYGQILLELVGVPVAAAITGITVWGRLQPAWRTLITRRGACGILVSTTVLSALFLIPVLVVMGLLIGGNDVMAATWLWRLAPWGWMSVAHQFPGRWLMIVGLSLLIGSVAMGTAVVGARRAAIRN